MNVVRAGEDCLLLINNQNIIIINIILKQECNKTVRELMITFEDKQKTN